MIQKLLMSIVLLLSLSLILTNALDEMPNSAKPGQCFTKAFYPPKYTKVTKIKSTKKVLLKDASVKYDVIPAKYSIYNEKVKISDGREKIISIPAVYKTVYEQVLIEPAKKIWRKNLNNSSPEAFNSCVQSALSSGMDVHNARVGTCFYEHFQAEKYVNISSKILAWEARERIEIIPATYKTVVKKIVTDTTNIKLLPSVAIYKKVQDKIIVEPAKSEWKKTICGDKGCNQSEVVCLIEVPATYKSITKRIVLQPAIKKSLSVSPKVKMIKIEEMVSPARSRSIVIPPKYTTINQRIKSESSRYYWSDSSGKYAFSRMKNQCNKICLTKIPAQYKKVSKQVMVSPASTKKIRIPAKYTIVKMKRIEEKSSYKKIVIPAEYLTVLTERERTKGYAKWMPMICEDMLTVDIIRKVQRALAFNGFYKGAIDGVWSFELKSSVRAYQREKGLAITNKLSIETMKSLAIF